MSTVTVRYLIGGTVTEDVHTAERITYQMFPDGRLHVRLYTAGTLAECVVYRRAERVHRIDRDLALVPREERT